MIILCTVDITTREVTIPSDQRIASYDHKVDVIRFQVETIPGFSLDTSSIKIAAQGPNKARHDYAVDPATVAIEEETGYITFDWPIPQGVTEMPEDVFGYGSTGQLIFAVCAEIIDGSTVSKAWHSDDGIITVVAHLEPESGGGEDPEEEATNRQMIGQLQTATAILQRAISGIASGTPPTADSTSEMDPDESTVYINTTDGNWYYWDGSAWQIGGVYGGAATSTTFDKHGVPADDFAVGEALAGKADADDVTEIDERVTALENDTDSGVSAEQKVSLINFLSALGGAFVTTDGQDLFDAFLEAWADYYTVSNNLTHCTTSNDSSTVDKNGTYTAVLTADEFYTITLVKVMMGGVDVTSTAYSNGVISIPEVTGALAITATAASDDEWTDGVPYNVKWKEGYNIANNSGEESADSNRKASQYLPCDGLYHIIASGIYAGSGMFFYDTNKNFVRRINVSDNAGIYCKASNANGSAAYFRVVKNMSDNSQTLITPTVLPTLEEGVTPVAGVKYKLPYIDSAKISSDGSGTVADTGTFCSDFVPCYGFSKITKFSTGRCGGRFYDSNKAQLSSVSYSDHGEYTIPEGAAYFRFEGSYTYNLSYPYVYLTE